MDCQYGIEPAPGEPAHRERIEELRDAIDELPNYRSGARIIIRPVTYGPWQCVTPGLIAAVLDDEAAIAAGQDDDELTSDVTPAPQGRHGGSRPTALDRNNASDHLTAAALSSPRMSVRQ